MYGSVHGRKKGNFGRSTDLLIKAGAKLPQHLSGSPEVVEVLRRYGRDVGTSAKDLMLWGCHPGN